MLSVLQTEALKLPSTVERIAKKPHAIYMSASIADYLARLLKTVYNSKASTATQLLTVVDIFQVSVCHERASSKRFLNKFSVVPPTTGFLCSLHRKNNKKKIPQ